MEIAEKKFRIPHHRALAMAEQVCTLLEPYNHKIEILGSIRRRRVDVGDIEIMTMPKIVPADHDLFGDVSREKNLHFDFILQNIGLRFDHRPDKRGQNACGERYQRLVYFGEEEFPLDIFCVLPPAQWGLQKIIRTGPADYSKRLVTPRNKGGTRLPHGFTVEGGAIRDPRGQVVQTPEEKDVYNFLGIHFVEPEDRY